MRAARMYPRARLCLAEVVAGLLLLSCGSGSRRESLDGLPDVAWSTKVPGVGGQLVAGSLGVAVGFQPRELGGMPDSERFDRSVDLAEEPPRVSGGAIWFGRQRVAVPDGQSQELDREVSPPGSELVAFTTNAGTYVLGGGLLNQVCDGEPVTTARYVRVTRKGQARPSALTTPALVVEDAVLLGLMETDVDLNQDTPVVAAVVRRLRLPGASACTDARSHEVPR